MDYIELIDSLKIDNQMIFLEYAYENVQINESINISEKFKKLGSIVIQFIKKCKEKIQEFIKTHFQKSKIQKKILNDNVDNIKDADENNINNDIINNGFDNANSANNNENDQNKNQKLNTYKSDSLINISIKILNDEYIEQLKNRYNDIFHLYLLVDGTIVHSNCSVNDVINGKNPAGWISGSYKAFKEEFESYKNKLDKNIKSSIFKEEKIKQSKFSKSISSLIINQINKLDDIDKLLNENIKNTNKHIDEAEKAINKIDFKKISDFLENNNYDSIVKGTKNSDMEALSYIDDLKKLLSKSISVCKLSINELAQNLSDILKARSLYISYTNVIKRAQKRNPGLVEY